MFYQQRRKFIKKENFSTTIKKWQDFWDRIKIYQTKQDLSGKKMYVLVEFPYPSGSGLHVGHAFCFTGADVYARFKRARGENVLFPMGWDAFGLPTENYAIKEKKNPAEITKRNTDYFKKQMREMAFSFDWGREVDTTDPKYYKWTQWIFLQLFKRGLVYKQEMPINWCPQCKIGLANEEVINGCCERCGTKATRRNISQWVVKITAYAERLIKGLEKTEFIEKVKIAQINWVGKSDGAEVIFKIKNTDWKLKIFTTRPDTLWGATFMVLSPEHYLIQEILRAIKDDKKSKEIRKYIAAAKKKSDLERTELIKEKTGVFSGFYAINPVNNKEIPIWISDFVLATYGTGAIMAVPGHDERDWQFAKKYGLEIVPVIKPEQNWDFNRAAYTEVDKGKIINSGSINGLTQNQALEKMIVWLERRKIGHRAKNYHLRDWIFSRQHYWGEPIPLVFCSVCEKKIKNKEIKGLSLGEILNPGWMPVNENDLPVLLPRVKNYQPTKTGESPLAKIKQWTKVKCPRCGHQAKRETDTMPNWAGSNWYFLRYIDPQNDQFLADKDKLKKWLPVDVYIGGDEHNTLHLLYSRFIYQFLWDIGIVPKEYPEPYIKRISHGVILGPDNQRMSKSRGNVIIPEQIIKKFDRYGPDILRMYLMFIGPFDGTMAWNSNALMGVKKFLDRVENYINRWRLISKENVLSLNIKQFLHRTIKKITDDMEAMKFNTAVASLMGFFNKIIAEENKNEVLAKDDLEKFLILLSPFVPYFCEEQWQKVHGANESIFQQSWPTYDSLLIKAEQVELVVQINGKVRLKIFIDPDMPRSQIEELVKKQERIKNFLQDRKIKKVIFVPQRLINLVV